jgi:hypothetical protein
MATMTIKYDNRNKTVTNLLNGLIYSGIIQPVDAKEKRIAEFESALREAREMAKDIAKNGIDGYQTMDEFLKTLD